MATLAVLVEQKRTDHALKEGQTLIGRRPECTIVVSHPTVSGRHAVVHAEGGAYGLEDVGRRSGAGGGCPYRSRTGHDPRASEPP